MLSYKINYTPTFDIGRIPNKPTPVMKILVLSITLSTSVLSGALNELSIALALPSGLEIGKTLRTDLDPLLSSKDDVSFFSSEYDAHFDDMGFLSEVVLEQSKGHEIPASWGLEWNSSLDDVSNALSTLGTINVSSPDVTKSPTVKSLSEVSIAIGEQTFRFQVIDWKEGKDGLSRIVIE